MSDEPTPSELVVLVQRACKPLAASTLFSVARGLAAVALIAAVSLAGCGKGGRHLSYQERIRSLEALYTRCGAEPSDDGYLRCLRRNEGTIKSYLNSLCPHPGGYTFEGAHEPCPAQP